MAINTWSKKLRIWSEGVLLTKKQINLQLAFTMLIGLLHPSEWSEVPARSPEYQDLAQRIKADFVGDDLTSSSQSFWLSWEGLHTRSLQLAGLIAYSLKVGGFEDVPRSDLLPLLRLPPPASNTCSGGAATCTPTLPSSPYRVPLLENFSDDGIKSQSSSWQEWYTSRARDLVENIEDGVWYGYYVYTLESTDKSIDPVLGSKDPAMENIYFKLDRGISSTETNGTTPQQGRKAAPRASSGKMALEARGCKDGITGEFDFIGTVTTHTGMISLRKKYKGAHYWEYDGVMTPLGIVGEWGKEGTGYHGYFWLWKRSWMVDDIVQRTYRYS